MTVKRPRCRVPGAVAVRGLLRITDFYGSGSGRITLQDYSCTDCTQYCTGGKQTRLEARITDYRPRNPCIGSLCQVTSSQHQAECPSTDPKANQHATPTGPCHAERGPASLSR